MLKKKSAAAWLCIVMMLFSMAWEGHGAEQKETRNGLQELVEVFGPEGGASHKSDGGQTNIPELEEERILEMDDIQAIEEDADTDQDEIMLDKISSFPLKPEQSRIAVGSGFILILDDGHVWAWGGNTYGQLGDGTYVSTNTPQQISDFGNVTAVSAGFHHSMALKADGTVWAWGNNSSGQLGDGTTATRSKPVQVAGLDDVKYIAAGAYHSLAVKKDGTVWSWGRAKFGNLGIGTDGGDRSTPVQVEALADIAMVSAYQHSMALGNDGTVWAWGDNQGGTVGDGTQINRNLPVKLEEMNNIVHIQAGRDLKSMAVSDDGRLWCWGSNSHSLVAGSDRFQLVPTLEDDVDVKVAAAGTGYLMVLKNDGDIWSAGKNRYGQLGDGTITDRKSMERLNGLSNIVEIVTGPNHTAALDAEGQIWAWGKNKNGILGMNNPTSYSPVPLKIFKIRIAGNPDPGTELPETEIKIWVEKGKTYDITISGTALESLNGRTFSLAYSSSLLAVDDLCVLTGEQKLQPGPVKGSGIVITRVSDGEILFMVDRQIPDGKRWSGVLNVIRFTALQNGEAELSVAGISAHAFQDMLQLQGTETYER